MWRRESSYFVGGKVNWGSHYGEQEEDESAKDKNPDYLGGRSRQCCSMNTREEESALRRSKCSTNSNAAKR